jgi:TetR/AcrR family transcriptional regulator, ethionamide resistance regulator
MSSVRAQRRADLGSSRLDTRTAVLAALEEILEETPLHKVSVAQILAAAGVSRGGFYSYFESKYEAAGALLADVMEEIHDQWRPFVDSTAGADPREALDAVLRASVALWGTHGAIARTTHQYWASVPELGHQWLAAVERFTTEVAAAIDRARAAGTVPPGDDSRTIAAAGLWATEQLTFVVNSRSSVDLPDVRGGARAAMNLWTGLLYGEGLQR